MGREVQKGGDISIPVADSCSGLQKTTKFCKAIILQLKNKLKHTHIQCLGFTPRGSDLIGLEWGSGISVFFSKCAR